MIEFEIVPDAEPVTFGYMFDNIQEGEIYKNTATNDYYKLVDGKLRVSGYDEWIRISDNVSYYFAYCRDGKRQFVQVREKIKDADKLINFHFDYRIVFPDCTQGKDWAEALLTFSKLKCHPLAVKSMDGKPQHVILNTVSSGRVFVSSGRSELDYKLDCLSPAFNSEEDAKKAIEDIGEDKLVHMFKTLQGVL